jgi:hypothetical protein
VRTSAALSIAAPQHSRSNFQPQHAKKDVAWPHLHLLIQPHAPLPPSPHPTLPHPTPPHPTPPHPTPPHPTPPHSTPRESIVSKLAAGTTLVVDRYAYSGVAFTAAKHVPGLDASWCMAPDAGLPAPDAVFFLSLPAQAAEARGGYGEERYEKAAFQAEVLKQFQVRGGGGGVWGGGGTAVLCMLLVDLRFPCAKWLIPCLLDLHLTTSRQMGSTWGNGVTIRVT